MANIGLPYDVVIPDYYQNPFRSFLCFSNSSHYLGTLRGVKQLKKNKEFEKNSGSSGITTSYWERSIGGSPIST
jgi:hypothetical protein